ncbi:alkaline phosphatase family protein [Belliella pelovolcani]|uniref:Predicted pyrophosphatase or phosphodiesterase, AlkP superfamily n=1 Tax=Belliella pelovolcani TaxID=529505 RepID=A0A1N7PPC5_9BACT|nr:alkaline phosphatase family protein [Belliella pelovolcani]SIT12239.1 Predicted pyrophosphatase or phosphodiesterase, AlkP superfamily [Belliella pelovolcani]
MHISNIKILAFLFIGLVFTACSENRVDQKPLKTLVVIIDGLRPDYINETNTPNLYKLAQEGVNGQNSHSIFPTLTRVNSTSYATGSYPYKHGILGNSIYLPEVNPTKGINTGDVSALIEADQILNGNLLHTKTFGEWVAESKDVDFTVYSTGTTGQSYLLNQKIKGRGIINPELILPASLREEVIQKVGDIPERGRPNLARHQWVTDAFIAFDLQSSRNSISTIWFSDPDGTAHATGIGSPLTLEAIYGVDQQIGRILNFINEKGLQDQVNIIISADHGFSTHKGEISLDELLITNKLKKDKESDDIVVVGGAIYFKDKSQIPDAIRLLQSQEWVGAIFTSTTRNNDFQGTHSQDQIYWDHQARASDIYVDVNWTDEVNEYGYAGFSYQRGIAGHGSASPFEMKTPFIAYGPSFKYKFENPLPTALIDIMPTILHIHHIPFDTVNVDGRVLKEVLKGDTKNYNAPNPTQSDVEHSLSGSLYQSTIYHSSWDGKSYFDYAITIRK